jgi:hypothetical protein
MAKRHINPSVGDIAGKIGDLVFYCRKGKPCVRKAPTRETPRTAAEEASQSRFRLAALYARAVLTDPVQKARYEQAASGTDLSAQNVAVSDFMKFPTLAEIDLSRCSGRAGEFIRIRAEEGKIGAAGVQVSLADGARAIVEQGAARLESDGVTWWYATQTDLPPDQVLWVTVTASDQPGNRTSKTLRHTTGN